MNLSHGSVSLGSQDSAVKKNLSFWLLIYYPSFVPLIKVNDRPTTCIISHGHQAFNAFSWSIPDTAGNVPLDMGSWHKFQPYMSKHVYVPHPSSSRLTTASAASAIENSTYWVPTLSQALYVDEFFCNLTMPEQGAREGVLILGGGTDVKDLRES